MKIANIYRESLLIFWKTLGISVKSSGKMWLMIILKVAKKQDSTLSLKKIFLQKPQGGKLIPRLKWRQVNTDTD